MSHLLPMSIKIELKNKNILLALVFNIKVEKFDHISRYKFAKTAVKIWSFKKWKFPGERKYIVEEMQSFKN